MVYILVGYGGTHLFYSAIEKACVTLKKFAPWELLDCKTLNWKYKKLNFHKLGVAF